MTRDEKQKLKESIEKEIEILSKEIASIQKALYPEKGQGPSDKVAHLNFKLDQSIHIQRYEEATKRLNRLKHAYLKIDTPQYGICQECEEPIPMERLKLMPESIYCVSCMEELGL
ncbi:C4-type zinc finger protein, DksA/TraR family [hydrothermal vent metagenome]|uniref:C4-type zinc finger protein, DksA/TraR family n=1 Tax=hydrothermal vent metagenome TaxID=652676 RepID=A0A1W1E747_9ZZZZ